MKVRRSYILFLIPLLFIGGLIAFAATHQVGNDSKGEDKFFLKRVINTEGIDPERVYTFMCNLIEKRPTTMTPFCADFGEAVYSIKWSRWGSDGAEGSGIYSYNDCTPNCAEGTTHETAVMVRLQGLFTDGKRYFLRDFSYTGVEPFIDDREVDGGWDTADFYINSPDMRTNP